MYTSLLNVQELSPADMRQANGGELFPTLLSIAVADAANAITNINIEPEGNCQHP